jgi:small-conductance mechanosensitive channel
MDFVQQLKDLFAQYPALFIAVELIALAALTMVTLRISQRVVDGVVAGVMERRAIGSSSPRLAAMHGTAEEAAEEAKRRRTLQSLLGSLARLAIFAVAVVVVLAIFAVDVGPAIAGLGLLGLGIGLGLQNLVRDLVAGAFVILENQYAQGDTVSIAGVTGTVEDFGLRRTVLRDADGTVHVVPNGLIAVASNQTRVWGRILVEVPVKDPATLDRAIAIAAGVTVAMASEEDWKARLLQPATVVGVKSVAATGTVITVTATLVAMDRAVAASEVRRRIVAEFVSEGISLGDLGPSLSR